MYSQIIDLSLYYRNLKKFWRKLYNARLENFLNRYDLLCPSQCGFRSNMSTSHAILEFVEEITNSLRNNKNVIGVFIDLKKAFDTVDHDVLAKFVFFLWCSWYSASVDGELFRR